MTVPTVASVCVSSFATFSPRASVSAICINPSTGALVAARGRCPSGHSEYGGAGVNLFDALWCGVEAMGIPCNYADAHAAMQSLAASGLRFFRFFAALWGPKHVHWLHSPDRHWAALDRLLDDARSMKLYAVPSIGAESWHEVHNRAHNLTGASRESLNELVTNASSAARRLARRYASELVRRYRARSEVLFWELGNELNLHANQRHSCGYTSNASAPDNGNARCFNTSALVAYTRDLAHVIHAIDPLRPVSSGFGITRPTAWHQESCNHPKRPTGAPADASAQHAPARPGAATGSLRRLRRLQSGGGRAPVVAPVVEPAPFLTAGHAIISSRGSNSSAALGARRRGGYPCVGGEGGIDSIAQWQQMVGDCRRIEL